MSKVLAAPHVCCYEVAAFLNILYTSAAAPWLSFSWLLSSHNLVKPSCAVVKPPVCLQDEPGGYKALVFDQGDRVSQSVSAADVADICLRALHESEVRA
jgi:hypothetical protein